jgi:hypothetical protein
VSGSSDAFFEFAQGALSLSGTRTAATALAAGQSALAGTFVTAASATTNLVAPYDQAPTANAAIFEVADSGDGTTSASEVSLVAFLEDIGADNLTDADFALGV